jgi:TRAP-type C4-dicarboxylate transport system permease small subunit
MTEINQTEVGKDEYSSKQLSVTEWVVVVLGVALVIIVAVTVFCRYILSIGIDWSDEVSRLIFIWLVFLGAYLAFKRKSHAAVGVLSAALPDRLKRYHALAVGMLEAAFMLILAWFGVIQVMDTARFGQITAGMGVPMSWLYVVMPVTAVLVTVSVLADAIRNFNRKGGDRNWAE